MSAFRGKADIAKRSRALRHHDRRRQQRQQSPRRQAAAGDRHATRIIVTTSKRTTTGAEQFPLGALSRACNLRYDFKSCGPDISTLVSSLRSVPQATVAKKPDRRGEHEATVNHCAGNAGCFRCDRGAFARIFCRGRIGARHPASSDWRKRKIQSRTSGDLIAKNADQFLCASSWTACYRGARLAKIRCNVRRCMFSRRAVSETLRLHIS